MGDLKDLINTRAEREWLATLKRLARALERIADQLENPEQGDEDE